MGIMPGFQTEKLSDAIEVLGLNQRAFHMLKRERIHTIADVIIRGKHGILQIRNMGELLTDHVFVKIANYLNVSQSLLENGDIQEIIFSNAKNHSELVSNKIIAENSPPISKTIQRALFVDSLSDSLNLLQINQRTWMVVKLRSNSLLTYEDIAIELGHITRSRVQQIINQALQKLRKGIKNIIVYCDYLESVIRPVRKKWKIYPASIDELATLLSNEILNPSLIMTAENLINLIAVLRLLVLRDDPWNHDLIYRRWRKLVLLVCMVHPLVKKHEKIDLLINSQVQTQRLHYREIAYLILNESKQPLHWSEIVNRAYRLQRRDSFNSTALYNALLRYPKLFVRVSTGTYALAEWGIGQADTYPDIIASILKSSNKPLSADAIYHKVNEIRQVKQSTLIMSLYMHPRFYRSLEKTYGLRVWLPPREKQTLRTPEWLVEDSDSFKRLEQAIQRGYDIENMIQADLENS